MITKNVSIDLNSKTKPFRHFFRATGYANADYTYTEPLKRMYDCLESFDGYPQYMRLHNILTLHGRGDHYIVHEGRDYGNPVISESGGVDAVVSIDSGGALRFNWELVDKVYDIIVHHGMHPIMEAVFMPGCIAKNRTEYYLPANFVLWEKVISGFVSHWIDRYGIDEVRKWYFEIANEPEQFPLWNRDPSSFFALYDYFEYAIHSLDSSLKVGGPAVKQWEDGHRLFGLFLDHCARGVNYKTGRYGTRLDFISVHSKGGHPDMAGPSMDYMFNPLKQFISVLKEYPEFRNTEFLNDESDIVWEGNMGIAHKSWLNFRNTHYAPGFIAKMIHTYCLSLEDELGINLGIVDSDNCHLTWEKSFFSGNRSQFTPLGNAPCTDFIKKPMFNIFTMLGKLNSRRYLPEVNDSEFGIKYGVLATAGEKDVFSFLVWNFEDGLTEGVNERTISLHITGLNKEDAYDVLHFRIDEDHSNAYSEWCKMGNPYPLSQEQIRHLRQRESLELFEKPRMIEERSGIDMDILLPMHAVSMIVVVKRSGELQRTEPLCEHAPEVRHETGVNGNTQIFLRWKYSSRRDLTGYRVYRKTDGTEYKCINEDSLPLCSYFVDMDIEPGVEYIYCVSAVYAGGEESGKSPGGTIGR